MAVIARIVETAVGNAFGSGAGCCNCGNGSGGGNGSDSYVKNACMAVAGYVTTDLVNKAFKRRDSK